jgi:hypothetical protein
MSKERKLVVAKTKNAYTKCSVKGCRKKALEGGKCEKHAKTGDHHHVSKKLDALAVDHVVSKIKRVRTAHHSPAAKAHPAKAHTAKTAARHDTHHPKVTKASNAKDQKNALNTISYWLGASASNCVEFFTSKAKK